MTSIKLENDFKPRIPLLSASQMALRSLRFSLRILAASIPKTYKPLIDKALNIIRHLCFLAAKYIVKSLNIGNRAVVNANAKISLNDITCLNDFFCRVGVSSVGSRVNIWVLIRRLNVGYTSLFHFLLQKPATSA